MKEHSGLYAPAAVFQVTENVMGNAGMHQPGMLITMGPASGMSHQCPIALSPAPQSEFVLGKVLPVCSEQGQSPLGPADGEVMSAAAIAGDNRVKKYTRAWSIPSWGRGCWRLEPAVLPEAGEPSSR